MVRGEIDWYDATIAEYQEKRQVAADLLAQMGTFTPTRRPGTWVGWSGATVEPPGGPTWD